MKKIVEAAILDCLKNFFSPKICVLLTPNDQQTGPQKAARSARLKAAKESVGAAEGAAVASEAKSSTTANKRTREQQETLPTK
jgi:hypothetical protein